MATARNRADETAEKASTDLDRWARAASIPFKLLSDPKRLQILGRLAQGESDAGDLGAELGEEQPAISHHLALLRHSGLVVPRRQGRHNYYQLTDRGKVLLEAAMTAIEPMDKARPGEPQLPQAAPELVFQATAAFEADLARIPAQDRSRIADAINLRAGLFVTDREGFERDLSRPFVPRIARGLDSTLYVMRVEHDLRVIFTTDDDPLFGRVIFTLLRLIKKREADSTYREVASGLYGVENGGQGE